MNKAACLLTLSFLSAFREALKSLRCMPPDCALGTWAGLVLGFAGRPLGLAFDGTSGVANTTAFLPISTSGVEGTLGVTVSRRGLPGNLSFVGRLKVMSGLLIGGPPVLITRGIFGGAFTGGIGGAMSVTGVLGIWILTEGGVSSTGRIRRSASLSKHHRTS